jgi:phosphomannomutase / phosphoglucomutase
MTEKKIQKKLFGTNGVRGVVGKDLTPELVFTIGESLGTMRKGCIAVGRDTRTSGETLVQSIKAGILATGSDVIDCGVLPTPALQYLVKDTYDGGAMITASHNPPEYNGVKIIEPDGTEMSDEETIKLEEIIFSHSARPRSWDQCGQGFVNPHLAEKYIRGIVSQFPGKPGKGMTVVVDPGSGPACLTTPRILTELGCKVITINGIPDGTFPGRLPEPSVEGLRQLADLVVTCSADFGVAHDGDADRAVFIDNKGQFIEENREFALIAQHACRNKKGVVVTPVSTGQIVEIVAKNEGCTIDYTPVGSIYVARKMRSIIEEGKSVTIGGEGNGGIIFPNHQFCRDGGMTCAMMVLILSQAGKNLSDLQIELPQRFIVKDKITSEKSSKILESLALAFPREIIDQTDGIKIFRHNSWALIRASGTEPIIRIIIDADTRQAGQSFYHEIIDKIALTSK